MIVEGLSLGWPSHPFFQNSRSKNNTTPESPWFSREFPNKWDHRVGTFNIYIYNMNRGWMILFSAVSFDITAKSATSSQMYLPWRVPSALRLAELVRAPGMLFQGPYWFSVYEAPQLDGSGSMGKWLLSSVTIEIVPLSRDIKNKTKRNSGLTQNDYAKLPLLFLAVRYKFKAEPIQLPTRLIPILIPCSVTYPKESTSYQLRLRKIVWNHALLCDVILGQTKYCTAK